MMVSMVEPTIRRQEPESRRTAKNRFDFVSLLAPDF
jgi:hypothetical protein